MSRSWPLPTLLAVLSCALAPRPAAAQTPAACLTPGAVVTQATLRFNAATPGNIVATGNTLGLSKEAGLNGPGTSDSIGTFVALDGASVDATPANPGNPWFAGTTSDWTQNGSSAELELPSEVEILHAELVWGGSFADPGDGNSVLADLSDPVRLIFGGDEIDVAPQGGGVTYSQGIFRYYARSATVTTFVAQHAPGAFTVAGVPGVATDTINSVHTAGWTLFVAYRDEAQPIRNLSIFFGGQFVDENTSQDYGFSGFCASSAGDLQGRAIITALEGDANRDGDVLCIAPGSAPANDDFVGLEGPNNPADNFFASQINGADGQLDTAGTFGGRNHDAVAVQNVSGGRQGWDITQIELSSADGSLAPGQTGAVLRTATLDDSYLPMAAGFSIDVVAPTFSPATGSSSSIDLPQVSIGDEVTVTVTLANAGQVAADDILFRMPLPAGLSLQAFTTDGAPGDAAGDAVQAADLTSGVDEGTLAPGALRVVTATFRVDAEPPSGSRYSFLPSWAYDWVMCGGEPPLSETFSGQTVFAELVDPATTGSNGTGGGNGVGSGGGNGAGGGNGGASSTATSVQAASVSASSSTGAGPATTGSQASGSGGDGGGATGDGGESSASGEPGQVTEADGCGCSAPGASARGRADVTWLLAVVGLAWIARRRR